MRYGSSVPCCLRFNPHILAGGNSNIQTGHTRSKFGIDIDQVQDLLKLVHDYKIKIIGLHAHTGSEISNLDVFIQEAHILYKLAEDFPEIQFLDLGSGFKVAYREEETETDVVALSKRIQENHKFFSKNPQELEIWFEPGKFLVSECGYFLVQVNGIKQTSTNVFAGVNSGFNHLIRPMFYNAYHTIVNLSNPDACPKLYDVVGYICEKDTFACHRMIPEIREGDILCFCNAGAYGFSMSSHYNSRLKPPEVLLWQGKDYLIRKRETWDTLLENQVFVNFE
jgi:diaminopimelate decarboxylase